MTALLVTVLATLSWAAAPPAGAAKKPVRSITVLVTNDDGVGAPGIDAVVEALRTQKKTKVVVVAPAENQSGSGSKTTEGGVQGSPATTASGYEAYAVTGFPADSVNYALDVLKVKPHVVISGSNLTQNLGPVVDASGTIGAARQAARRGIPALAVSQQLGDAPDFPTSGELAVRWLSEHRRKLAAAKSGAALTEITSINVPNCPDGAIRGLYETVPAPPGTPDVLSSVSDCASTQTSFANDVEAFNNGYASITKVPVAAAAG